MAAKYLTSITALRKKFPKSKLGFRERSILEKSGAKITKSREYKDCYRVTAANSYFVFSYGSKIREDFKIIM